MIQREREREGGREGERFISTSCSENQEEEAQELQPVARSFPESKTCKLFLACRWHLLLPAASNPPALVTLPTILTTTPPLPLPGVSIYLPRPWARITGPRRRTHDPGRRGTRNTGPVTDRWARPTVNGGPRPVAEGIVRYPAAWCRLTVTLPLSVRERRETDDEPAKLPGKAKAFLFFLRSRRPTARRQASRATASTRRHAAARWSDAAAPPRRSHRRRRGHVTSCRFPESPAARRDARGASQGDRVRARRRRRGKNGVRSRWLSSEMARGAVGFGM
jgi:hypothetical protein